MGRLLSGINGHIHGKIGTIIGSSWKGIPYVKGPYKKRTGKVGEGEAGNRSKFAEAHFWLRPLLKFVRVGFRGYTETVEGFLAAKSWLLRNAFEGVPPDMYVNPALMKVSHGDLPLSNDIMVSKTGPGQLAFTWDPAWVEGGNAKDQVMLLAYDIDHVAAYYITTGQFRSTGADVLNIPKTKGKTWHLYLAFTAADRTSQSHSVYLGAITN